MRSTSIAAAVSILAALAAAPGVEARDATYQIITLDETFLNAIDTASIRRKGTGVTARLVHGTRLTGSSSPVTDYAIVTAEYDCQWQKMRIRAYDRYRADGTLAQSYRDADWTGAPAGLERGWLCFGTGGLGEVRYASDHALGKAFLARTLTIP